MKRKFLTLFMSLALLVTSCISIQQVNAENVMIPEETTESEISGGGIAVVKTFDISATTEDNIIATLYSNGTMNISGNGNMLNIYCSTDDSLVLTKSEILDKIGDSENIGDILFPGEEHTTEEEATTEKSEVLSLWGNITELEEIRNSVKKVIIEDGVTNIGAGVFANFVIEEVSIPSSVKTVAKMAFADCELLTEIIIPEGVTSIGEEAFIDCIGLESVTLPSTLETISNNIFDNCDNLKTIDINMTENRWNARSLSLDNSDLPDTTSINFIPVNISEDVKVEGYQYSTTVNGYRVVSSVEPTINNQKVASFGLIYGLKLGGVTEDDMCYNNSNIYTSTYTASQGAIQSTQFGDSETATYYTFTMINNGSSALALSAEYMVRAFAVLENGEILYSEVKEFSIYEICDYLYQNECMNVEEKHNFLYDNILSIVDPSYKKIDFDWGNTLVS